MENFDIENLERKNIFKKEAPFFDEMQKNVLREIQPVQIQNEGRIFKMNWMYAAAAAVAMIFGILFFVNRDQADKNDYIALKTDTSRAVESVNNSNTEDKQQDIHTTEEISSNINLTSAPKSNHIERKTTTDVSSKETEKMAIKTTTVQTPDTKMEQVLSGFTSAELADLGDNTEQDVYLDLYN